MKKKQLITALATSTLVLSTAGTALADEVSSPETLNEVSVVTETQPVDPSTPIVPDVPKDPSTPPTTPDVPTVPSTPPSTDGSDTDNSGGDNNPGTPSNPGTGDDSNTPSQPTVPNPPITDDAVNKDDQGNITIKPQPVAPNQTVVGTQNGQLLVQDTSGNTRLADVTEFGGQKNDNGTVSFKTADGKTVTLPETGSTSGILLSLLGSGLLGLFGFFWKKKQL